MSKQKALGTRIENQAVTVFAPWFRYCERRALRGKNDAGDLAGLPIPIEVKAGVAQLSDAIREAKTVAARFGIPGQYAAYIHARGKPPAEAYLIFPAAFGAELLAAWDQTWTTSEAKAPAKAPTAPPTAPPAPPGERGAQRGTAALRSPHRGSTTF